MKLYNIHTHTECSHDSVAKVEEMALSAEQNGLFGFAVTDHLDCADFYTTPAQERIDKSFENAVAGKSEFRGRMLISAGVEVGDPHFDSDAANFMINRHNWDVILLSVHSVKYPGYSMAFSRIDFSGWSDDEIHKYLTSYFNDLEYCVNTFDYDICAHLTIPLRYIAKKYKKNVDITRYYPQTERVLKAVIRRDKTLEVNTSGYCPPDYYLMPDEDIIKMYKALGGKKITIGADAHIPGNISLGLSETAGILIKLGFDTLTYYHDRKPVYYHTGTADEQKL